MIWFYGSQRNLRTNMDNEGKSYDRIAADFAKMRDSFYTEQKYLDIFIQYLDPNSHILDVGCGSGYPIASYLVDKGFKVTGIDASKELLEIAKVNCPSMVTKYGDMRTIDINETFDAIIEWWAIFHLPKEDHLKMLSRFSTWLKKDGILHFTTGDREYVDKSSDMLNQELSFYSLDPTQYENYLNNNGYKILLKESDQEYHLVWLAKRL